MDADRSSCCTLGATLFGVGESGAGAGIRLFNKSKRPEGSLVHGALGSRSLQLDSSDLETEDSDSAVNTVNVTAGKAELHFVVEKIPDNGLSTRVEGIAAEYTLLERKGLAVLIGRAGLTVMEKEPCVKRMTFAGVPGVGQGICTHPKDVPGGRVTLLGTGNRLVTVYEFTLVRILLTLTPIRQIGSFHWDRSGAGRLLHGTRDWFPRKALG